MRKAGLAIICVALLGLSVTPATSEAGTSVGFGLHEAFVIPAYGPGYRFSDISFSLVFHQGHWWRPYRGGWYRSRWRTGPWGYVAPWRVPRIVPPVRHHRGPLHHDAPYWKHKRHWRRW